MVMQQIDESRWLDEWVQVNPPSRPKISVKPTGEQILANDATGDDAVFARRRDLAAVDVEDIAVGQWWWVIPENPAQKCLIVVVKGFAIGSGLEVVFVNGRADIIPGTQFIQHIPECAGWLHADELIRLGYEGYKKLRSRGSYDPKTSRDFNRLMKQLRKMADEIEESLVEED
jgi:hypothetical protein